MLSWWTWAISQTPTSYKPILKLQQIKIKTRPPCDHVWTETKARTVFKWQKWPHPSLLSFVVQSLRCIPTLCNPMDCSTPDFPVLHHLPEFAQFMSIELMMSSHHFILCHPLLLLPSTFPSIRVFSNESVLHIRWPKYWSFSISPSSEYSGLISFRIDWFGLLAVQGTLKSLLLHHNLKASIP